MDRIPTIAYKRYEYGKQYNDKLKYYSRATENENMINGLQWEGIEADGLSLTVFNVEKRIMDYKIASLSSQKIKGVYSIEGASHYIEGEELTKEKAEEIELGQVADIMTGNAEVMWEKLKMDAMIRRLLRDGFITGDMCVYTYWDSNIKTGQKATGNFVAERVNGGNVFFGNPNERDVQKQPYVLILIRDTIENLVAEAKANGMDKRSIELIIPDSDTQTQTGQNGQIELDGDSSTQKANAYLMFYKKDGKVYWSKSTRYVEIRKDVELGISRYPIAWSNWDEIENCYHGKAECSEIHPNQRFINKMFSMCMLWFSYNAFGKIAYDATRINGWTNEIGVAVPVQGSVDGVVQQLASGDFNNAVLMVIDYAIKYTKDFLGATDASLGESRADNTSALIVVQKASAVPLENIQARIHQLVEDIYLIWGEFMVNNYAKGRKVPTKQDGKIIYKEFTPKSRDRLLLNVGIEIGSASFWSEVAQQQTLDNLLMNKIITPIQYLERLPNGYVPKKQQLIDELMAVANNTPNPQEQSPVPQEQAPAPQGGNGIPQNPQFEDMATFFDGLPTEEKQRLMQMNPQDMQAELQTMMAGTPQ